MKEKTPIELLKKFKKFIQDLPTKARKKDKDLNTSIIGIRPSGKPEEQALHPMYFHHGTDADSYRMLGISEKEKDLLINLLVDGQIIFETDKDGQKFYELDESGAISIDKDLFLQKVDTAIKKAVAEEIDLGKELLQAYLDDVNQQKEENKKPQESATFDPAKDSTAKDEIEDDQKDKIEDGQSHFTGPYKVITSNSLCEETVTGTEEKSISKKTTTAEYPNLSSAIESSNYILTGDQQDKHKEAVTKIMVKFFKNFTEAELEDIKKNMEKGKAGEIEQPEGWQKFCENVGHFFNSVIRAVTFGKAGFDFSKKEARQAMNNPDGFTLDERYIQVLENEENKHATRLAKQKAEALKLQSQTKF